MGYSGRQDIFPSTGLTQQQSTALDQLVAACNVHEGTSLRVFPDLEPSTSVGDSSAEHARPVSQFLCFQDAALIGFAHMDGTTAVEASGVVHPAHRRQGIGRRLLAAVTAACRERGLANFLLVCDESAPSGRAFAEAVGARFRFAEYSLELDPAAASRLGFAEGPVRLRPATVRDLDTVARLAAAAFADPEDEVRERVERGMREPIQRYFLGMLDDEPIGTLRVSRHDPNIYITAFGVLPVYQRRGYGGQMLRAVIAMLLAGNAGPIFIEVETENRNALTLYQNCGFRQRSQYSYYQVDL